jgi:simple sugar transport system permease protein
LRDGLPIRFERRDHEGGVLARIAIALVALVLAMLAAVLWSGMAFSDFLPDLWRGTVGSTSGFGNVLVLAVPLVLTGLAAAVPLRLGLWNIGGEGQLFLGAWGAAAVAFTVPSLTGWALVPLMLAASAAAGAAWMAIPALARVYLNVNEIVSTLILNFAAGYWVLYWAGRRWPERQSPGGSKSRLIPEQGHLGAVDVAGVTVPVGVILGALACVLVAAVLARTRAGYTVSIAASSTRAARYAGIRTRRLTLSVLLVGGGFGGLAGAAEMMGNTFRYSDQLSNDTGYTGIVVAVLAGASAFGVLLMSLVFGVITVGANILRVGGASSEIVFVAYGLTLAFAAAGQGLSRYRLVRARSSPQAPPPTATAIDMPAPAAAAERGPA